MSSQKTGMLFSAIASRFLSGPGSRGFAARAALLQQRLGRCCQQRVQQAEAMKQDAVSVASSFGRMPASGARGFAASSEACHSQLLAAAGCGSSRSSVPSAVLFQRTQMALLQGMCSAAPRNGSANPVPAVRTFATRAAAEKATHKLKFKGGKIKAYTSLKSRFKVLKASGEVKRWKQGFRHKRTPKSKEQRQRLGKPALVYKAYSKVMKRLGMKGF